MVGSPYEDRIGIHRPGVFTSMQGPPTHQSHLLPASSSSSAWPVANTAFITKVYNPRPQTITHAWIWNGATLSGTFDIGIFLRANPAATLTRLASLGATAQATINVVEFVAFPAPVAVPEGEIFMALVFNNATATSRRDNIGPSWFHRIWGLGQAAAVHPLPTSLTATALTSFGGDMPQFGILNRLY